MLGAALRTVTCQDYDNLEILVSDNFSNDGTEDVVRNCGDKRVKYLNTGRRMSMSHNWEFALSHVHDGWVTIIGDDDGLLPNSIGKVNDIIRSAGVEALRSRVCSYKWPSITGTSYGRLGVPLQTGTEIRESRRWLARVLNGRATYLELPMLYNGGFVSNSVLNDIRSKTGSLYRSCIPDVYSAISISSVIDRYLFLEEPLAINGASKHSTGTSYFGKQNGSEATPVDKFASEPNIPFHEDLPLYADGTYPASIQALVYESYLQSRGLRPWPPQDILASQLAIILATSGQHEERIRNWVKQCAMRHQLDFDGIESCARRLKRQTRIMSIWTSVSGTINTWGIGSTDVPIDTVFEASVAAGEIRDSNPGRLANIRRLAKRALQKWSGRS